MWLSKPSVMIIHLAAVMLSFFPVSLSLITPEIACGFTADPSFCKSVLPTMNSPSNLYQYSEYFLTKSLQQALAFPSILNQSAGGTPLPPQANSALEDCNFLFQLNTEFLISSLDALNSTSAGADEADSVHTLLSGIVTNQDTCLDGITQANFLQIGNKFYDTFAGGSKLYSVALGMFAHCRSVNKRLTKPRRRLLDEMSGGGVPNWFRRQHRRMQSLQTVGSVVVAQDGSGNYRTINQAIAAAPNNNDGSKGFFVIQVKAGEYKEYVSIDKNKKYIMMVGDGIGKTIITGSKSAGGGSTTFNSATLAVVGEGFVAIGITVRNTAGPSNHQAVALRSGADRSAFYKCSFEGYQDTLYTHSLRQFYRECDIYGTVDFIFGNAAVVLQNCNIYARLPNSGQFNTLTAQGRTDPNQNTGTSIMNCNILATPELSKNPNVKTFLGRPWKEYSRTVFMQSSLGSLIDPSGWSPWSGSFALKTLHYGEYNNRGPGADTSRRVTWPGFHVMTATDANRFTVSNFVQGDVWLPKTTVPFTP